MKGLLSVLAVLLVVLGVVLGLAYCPRVEEEPTFGDDSEFDVAEEEPAPVPEVEVRRVVAVELAIEGHVFHEVLAPAEEAGDEKESNEKEPAPPRWTTATLAGVELELSADPSRPSADPGVYPGEAAVSDATGVFRFAAATRPRRSCSPVDAAATRSVAGWS